MLSRTHQNEITGRCDAGACTEIYLHNSLKVFIAENPQSRVSLWIKAPLSLPITSCNLLFLPHPSSQHSPKSQHQVVSWIPTPSAVSASNFPFSAQAHNLGRQRKMVAMKTLLSTAGTPLPGSRAERKRRGLIQIPCYIWQPPASRPKVCRGELHQQLQHCHEQDPPTRPCELAAGPEEEEE